MIGQMLLIFGLMGAWTSDGVRDGFHLAQTDQNTYWPQTYGRIVNYGNYHDYVTIQTASVAMAGTGAFLWSKQNPEWWRVAGVTVGTSLVGWMAREWLIDYIPTGNAFRHNSAWHSDVFGNVPDRSVAFQAGIGALGAGMATAAILWPRRHHPRWDIGVRPVPNGVEVAVKF